MKGMRSTNHVFTPPWYRVDEPRLHDPLICVIEFLPEEWGLGAMISVA